MTSRWVYLFASGMTDGGDVTFSPKAKLISEIYSASDLVLKCFRPILLVQVVAKSRTRRGKNSIPICFNKLNSC